MPFLGGIEKTEQVHKLMRQILLKILAFYLFIYLFFRKLKKKSNLMPPSLPQDGAFFADLHVINIQDPLKPKSDLLRGLNIQI